MTITSNEAKKNATISLVIRHDPRLSLIQTLNKLVLSVLTASAAIYAAVNLLIPSFSTVIINGTARKDYLTIISHTILLLVFAIVGRLCFRAFLANRVSKDLTERSSESILFDGNRFRYAYRPDYHILPESRMLVLIPLRSIRSIERDAFTNKITFKGSFMTAYAEHYDPNRPYYPTLGTLSEFVIYDYFEPSLTKILQEEGWIPVLPDPEV